MTKTAIVFLSESSSISMRERRILDRYSGCRVIFFIRSRIEMQAHNLRRYINGTFPDHVDLGGYESPNITRDIFRILNSADKDGLEVDITYATSYYTYMAMRLSMRRDVSIVYTHADGSVDRLNENNVKGHPDLDGKDLMLMHILAEDEHEIEYLSEETGINYKTLCRRLNRMADMNVISLTNTRPKHAFMTPEQLDMFIAMSQSNVFGYSPEESRPLR